MCYKRRQLQNSIMESAYRVEVARALCKPEDRIMSDDPVSLMSGGLSIQESSDILCAENEFGVAQSPHQGSYMISHGRQKSLMEPWEKSNIKPLEIFSTIHNLAEVPDVKVTETPAEPPLPTLPTSSNQMSVPKMMQIDEYNEELFQLDDENDDLEPEPMSLAALKVRKMSRSTEFLNPYKNEDSTMEESTSHKQLQKFRSESNLHSGESNLSLVERVTMLNLTASKKTFKSSSMSPLQRENSEEHLCEGESKIKNWFMKKACNVSSREMNAITPFSS